MVGFMPNEAKDGVTISGIEVLAQNETPGLGANMKNPGNNLEKSALNNDPSTMTFKVKKEGGSFDALTGSTISSRAYANAMETAYAGYLKATGQLEDIKIEDTTSGATDTASGATTDAASGATNNK
jgi:electron transport complex protein RnfG